ncbi:hypothetical protein H696_03973 [Fonticula alba]|uniref:Postreplication repair E3 ubiquitin-protein ligase RAD18 n=1 Tax=Fonticula alba TaxID=691883 RepID=A0A058Z7R8_FONAL|nr:hypothetical protein H696_03973 [Fonticula alba]KCV69552.1 hypothetical protein H696_03973 [Fonticula alba]|eukprot:XP_009496117.1 hypothetical protein H696_03973 [Fonticula alba]
MPPRRRGVTSSAGSATVAAGATRQRASTSLAKSLKPPAEHPSPVISVDDDPADWPDASLRALDEACRCPICRELMTVAPVMSLRCRHTYCSMCVMRALDVMSQSSASLPPATVGRDQWTFQPDGTPVAVPPTGQAAASLDTGGQACPVCREPMTLSDIIPNGQLLLTVKAFAAARPSLLRLARLASRPGPLAVGLLSPLSSSSGEDGQTAIKAAASLLPGLGSPEIDVLSVDADMAPAPDTPRRTRTRPALAGDDLPGGGASPAKRARSRSPAPGRRSPASERLTARLEARRASLDLTRGLGRPVGRAGSSPGPAASRADVEVRFIRPSSTPAFPSHSQELIDIEHVQPPPGGLAATPALAGSTSESDLDIMSLGISAPASPRFGPAAEGPAPLLGTGPPPEVMAPGAPAAPGPSPPLSDPPAVDLPQPAMPNAPAAPPAGGPPSTSSSLSAGEVDVVSVSDDDRALAGHPPRPDTRPAPPSRLIPKTVYTLMTDKKIRELLNQCGIPSRGPRATLVWRHSEFRLRWNSFVLSDSTGAAAAATSAGSLADSPDAQRIVQELVQLEQARSAVPRLPAAMAGRLSSLTGDPPVTGDRLPSTDTGDSRSSFAHLLRLAQLSRQRSQPSSPDLSTGLPEEKDPVVPAVDPE